MFQFARCAQHRLRVVGLPRGEDAPDGETWCISHPFNYRKVSGSTSRELALIDQMHYVCGHEELKPQEDVRSEMMSNHLSLVTYLSSFGLHNLEPEKLHEVYMEYNEGKLDKTEVPERMHVLFEELDVNDDGVLDAGEVSKAKR